MSLNGTFRDKVQVYIDRAVHKVRFGPQGSIVDWRGLITVDPYELEKAINGGWNREGVEGWIPRQIGPGLILLLPKPNLVTNSGVNISLDRLFAINGPPTQVQTMGVDDGASNPGAGTDNSTSGSSNRRLVAFDSTPTRSAQTISADGTFTNSNVSFIMKRLFLSKASAGTTDSSGDLYAMTNVFTIDLTIFTTWSQTFTAEVTGSGS